MQNAFVVAKLTVQAKSFISKNLKALWALFFVAMIGTYPVTLLSANAKWNRTVAAAENGRWAEFVSYFPDGGHRNEFDRKAALAVIQHYLTPKNGWTVVNYPHEHGGVFDGRELTDCVMMGKNAKGKTINDSVIVASLDSRVITLPIINKKLVWSSSQSLFLSGALQKIAIERFPKKLEPTTNYPESRYREVPFSYYEFLLAERQNMLRIGARCLYYHRDDHGVERDSLESHETYLESMKVDFRPIAAKYGRIPLH